MIQSFSTFFIPLTVAFISCNNNPKEKKEDTSSPEITPNILWIVADDVGIDLGCYGNPLIQTPNLDKLASQGIKYDNFYTVAAVSSVSRSSMITGMYPVSINCHQHRTQFKDSLPESILPITEYFKKAGYFVSNKGKTDYNFIHNKDSLFDGINWEQRKEGQPFFSQVQITLPHRPFLKDTVHPINPDQIELPPYYPNHPLVRKDWAMYLETIQILDQKVGELLDQLEKDGLAENTIVFFFGDQGRPHVRAKQFLYDAGIHTPLIIRWPGVLDPGEINTQLVSNVDLAPAIMNIANIPIPDYMQGEDFLDKSSIPRKYIFAMRDRRDETVDRIRMIRGEKFKYIRNYYTDRPYTQFNAYKKSFYPVLTLMQVMYKNGELNSEQARFMAKYRPSEELYDLENDPYELYNLAEDKKYIEIKNTLSKNLDEWVSETDKGVYPEDTKEILHAQELMTKMFKKNMENKGLNEDISDEKLLKYWEKELLGK